jgi:hypothetical protein
MNMRSTAVAAALALVLLASSAAAGRQLRQDPVVIDGQTGNGLDTRPDLGLAEDYAILAGFGITNVYDVSRVVTGDMGIWPSATTAITAFVLTADVGFSTSPIVTGNVYAMPTDIRATIRPPVTTPVTAVGPGNVKDAMEDLITAFDTISPAVFPTALTVGTPIDADMAGKTFGPGLFTSTGSMAAAGDFTLKGGATDIFIFRMATTFTMAAGAKVILSGGALASNIFWQVGTSATIFTTAVMHGTIMAPDLIATQTGSSINGRLLVGPAGSVTLGMTTVVKC